MPLAPSSSQRASLHPPIPITLNVLAKRPAVPVVFISISPAFALRPFQINPAHLHAELWSGMQA
eukprot:5424156-Pleurochrysis_carterae.AAC.1